MRCPVRQLVLAPNLPVVRTLLHGEGPRLPVPSFLAFFVPIVVTKTITILQFLYIAIRCNDDHALSTIVGNALVNAQILHSIILNLITWNQVL